MKVNKEELDKLSVADLCAILYMCDKSYRHKV